MSMGVDKFNEQLCELLIEKMQTIDGDWESDGPDGPPMWPDLYNKLFIKYKPGDVMRQEDLFTSEKIRNRHVLRRNSSQKIPLLGEIFSLCFKRNRGAMVLSFDEEVKINDESKKEIV